MPTVNFLKLMQSLYFEQWPKSIQFVPCSLFRLYMTSTENKTSWYVCVLCFDENDLEISDQVGNLFWHLHVAPHFPGLSRGCLFSHCPSFPGPGCTMYMVFAFFSFILSISSSFTKTSSLHLNDLKISDQVCYLFWHLHDLLLVLLQDWEKFNQTFPCTNQPNIFCLLINLMMYNISRCEAPSMESIKVIKGNSNFMFDEFQGWGFKGEIRSSLKYGVGVISETNIMLQSLSGTFNHVAWISWTKIKWLFFSRLP